MKQRGKDRWPIGNRKTEERTNHRQRKIKGQLIYKLKCVIVFEFVCVYLVHKNIVQVVGETACKRIFEFRKQTLLLFDCQQLFMTYRRKKVIHTVCNKIFKLFSCK